MYLKYNAAIDIYSLAILLFMLSYSRQTVKHQSLSQRLFRAMLIVTMVLIVTDFLGWLEGVADPTLAFLFRLGNFIQFALNTVIPSLYVLYVHDQAHHDGVLPRKWLRFLLPLYLANLSLIVAGLFTGWFFTIDAENRYHRGPLYFLSLFMFAFLVGISLTIVFRNRHLLEKRTFWALVAFPIPPLVAVVLQTLFYGMSLNFHGITFALIVIFFQIQNQTLHTDHLTGIFNRKKLESTLNERIRNAAGGKGFGAMMIDLDGFKHINDTYGHDVGDDALITAANVLQSALRKGDFIARYGGDEFVVLLNTQDEAALNSTVARIRSAIEAFNQLKTMEKRQSEAMHSRNRRFDLSFSIGYAIYDPAQGMSADHFMKLLDNLMYRDKARNRELQANNR